MHQAEGESPARPRHQGVAWERLAHRVVTAAAQLDDQAWNSGVNERRGRGFFFRRATRGRCSRWPATQPAVVRVCPADLVQQTASRKLDVRRIAAGLKEWTR